MNKYINLLLHPKKVLLSLASKGVIYISDETYLKILYKLRVGKEINLENPKGFNEKLQWLKLNDKNPEYTNLVDKYEVKKIIADKIGNEYIIPTLGVYEKFDDINFDMLPNEFVIKCTHDSGGVVICKNKNLLDKKKAKKKINKSLKHNYFYTSREWPYKNVKPRIIVEPYMKDNNSDDLIDYKFMCFNGKVQCSFVCTDRRSEDGLKVTFFDLDWNKMPFERHYRSSEKEIPKPINYELMIELSEKLSKDIPFVRVDFYEINGQVYFGELTFFPGAGFEEFRPDEWDYKLGKLIDLTLVRGKENEQ